MKLHILVVATFTALITWAIALPTTGSEPATWNQIGENSLGPVYSNVSPPKRNTGTWFRIGVNKNGPVYSNIAPQKRDTDTWFEVGSNENGPIYSNVALTVSKLADSPINPTIVKYNTWLLKQHSKELSTRDEGMIEKRLTVEQGIAAIVVCMTSCALRLAPATGINDNIPNRARYCFDECLLEVGFSQLLKDGYLRRYGNMAFP
ncbi:hypothetical protein VTL71DRAFT_4453 [Oculimacula yallundae]|uniref:Uncharacterized protein n=1 Tax=Oculimacula yallundae TaxID=86028 RepID=A0ABR4C227_9HELO